jgi:hypothetical protein
MAATAFSVVPDELDPTLEGMRAIHDDSQRRGPSGRPQAHIAATGPRARPAAKGA